MTKTPGFSALTGKRFIALLLIKLLVTVGLVGFANNDSAGPISTASAEDITH